MLSCSTIEIVLFMLDENSFLLVVEVTSQFPVVRILNKETCTSVVNALKGIYCDFGLPRKVITDNGPCFKAAEFNDFHDKLGVVTEKSSVYNHQSKQIIVKNQQNVWITMLIFKAMWIPKVQKNPAELLNSHKFRTSLPIIDFNQRVNEPEVKNLIDKHQNTTVTGKKLPKVDMGVPVLYEKNLDNTKIKCPQWCKGMIKNCENPRKYHILTDDSERIVTRPRCHIKAYFTRPGRVSKAPQHLIEQN